MKPRPIPESTVRAVMREMGSKGGHAQPLEAKSRGGKASAAKLSPEERREKGRKAGLASQAARRKRAD